MENMVIDDSLISIIIRLSSKSRLPHACELTRNLAKSDRETRGDNNVKKVY